jgi:O-antigen/teichoic acid export membrane protein
MTYFSNFNKKASIFVFTNICAKGSAALAQLYAIYIFTKMHTDAEAALIFILSGYAIWFQMFEMGLSQTLQNKFNARQIQSQEIIGVIIAHYFLLVLVGILILTTPYLTNILLSADRRELDDVNRFSFSIGAAILILGSSNVLVQRFLLIVNKGVIANYLLLMQSLLAIGFLFLYQEFDIKNILVSVMAYFGPQILVFIPMLILLFLKYRKKKLFRVHIGLTKIFQDSLGFGGIGVLSAVFLGSDYYFVARYLDDKEVISYYFVTRIFFISFVVYYAYLLHRMKRISSRDLTLNMMNIKLIAKDSIVVGVMSVITIFLIVLLLNARGDFKNLMNQSSIDWTLLFVGFLYFLVRVCRDIGVVLMSSLNEKKVLYQVYFIEIFFSLMLMASLAPLFSGVGIFFSMTISCLLSLIFLVFKFRTIEITFSKLQVSPLNHD